MCIRDSLYVTATSKSGIDPDGVLFTSKDHGATFTPHTVPFVKGDGEGGGNPERSMFIAGVDPTNADRVYLRTSTDPNHPSRLLLWDESTATLRTLFTSQGGLGGFAITPDASKVYVGGPMDGLFVASTVDYAFKQRSAVQVQCLSIQSDGLWACSNEVSGFIGGLSHDDGVTFEAKLHFCDVQGPLACPAGSTTNGQCVPAWPPQRDLLGCAPSSSSSSSSSSGGVDAGGTDAEAPAAGVPSGSGSGCAAGPESGDVRPVVIAGVAAALAAAFLTRRRRRDRRP